MKPTFVIGTMMFGLAMLVGCSTPTPPPATHPTWCNKDPKEEPHFHDCNGNLYLPGHEPEECIPEEPEVVVQKPVEPPTPDPIIGAYHIFYYEWPTRQYVYRVFASGSDSYGLRWERKGSTYRFFANSNPEQTKFNLTYSSAKGDPNIVMQDDTKFVRFEGIKKSDDPNFLFDFYVLAADNKTQHPKDLKCVNIGRKERPDHGNWYKEGSPPNFAETLQECEKLCPALASSTTREYTCPGDRR